MQPYLNRFAGSKRLAQPDLEDAVLAEKRRKNDLRHESNWTSIIRRYERDFSGIADEIDLVTGKLVVDNGHLKSMRGELDMGPQGTETTTGMGLLRKAMMNQEAMDEELGRDGGDERHEANGQDGGDEDDRKDEEGIDSSEDELSSDWPDPLPSGRRSANRSCAVESNLHAQRQMSPTLSLSGRDEATPSIESPSTSVSGPSNFDIPIIHPGFTQISMPQMEVPGDMQSKMLALIPVFQAQMMAFMNIVMPPSEMAQTQIEPHPKSNDSGNQSAMTEKETSPPAHVAHQPAPSRRQDLRQVQMRRAVAGHYNMTSSAVNKEAASRGTTPGRKSLWSLPGSPSTGRKKKSRTSELYAQRPKDETRPADVGYNNSQHARAQSQKPSNNSAASIMSRGMPYTTTSSVHSQATDDEVVLNALHKLTPSNSQVTNTNNQNAEKAVNHSTISSLLADVTHSSPTTPLSSTMSARNNPRINLIDDSDPSDDEMESSELDEIDLITPRRRLSTNASPKALHSAQAINQAAKNSSITATHIIAESVAVAAPVKSAMTRSLNNSSANSLASRRRANVSSEDCKPSRAGKSSRKSKRLQLRARGAISDDKSLACILVQDDVHCKVGVGSVGTRNSRKSGNPNADKINPGYRSEVAYQPALDLESESLEEDVDSEAAQDSSFRTASVETPTDVIAYQPVNSAGVDGQLTPGSSGEEIKSELSTGRRNASPLVYCEPTSISCASPDPTDPTRSSSHLVMNLPPPKRAQRQQNANPHRPPRSAL